METHQWHIKYFVYCLLILFIIQFRLLWLYTSLFDGQQLTLLSVENLGIEYLHSILRYQISDLVMHSNPAGPRPSDVEDNLEVGTILHGRCLVFRHLI